ncbi:MAG TPA: response regulator transcription factor [Oscillospiraceae bacterium]|nr:response regulator transcription factor [Oscillospiraceae bacterium]
MIRLLFVDDQSIILSFLEKCFSDKNKYEIVGSITQAQLIEIWCERKKPDAIFLDIQTKERGTNGLVIAEIIKKKFPDIKILIMTGYDEISYLPRAQAVGADAFLLKSYPESYFIEALESVVHKDEKVFPEENKTIPVEEGQSSLTARELEVLRLICQDYSNREIAGLLHITESTVKRHIENLFRKTGKSGRVGLVAYVLSGGWINPNI